ncbi:MAG: tRNA pseudouridine(13) synthase TruD, partial [Campylobacter sp.]|nr:tRNA pseudouridine(13) synthase TruD [Campylobacter sp.]
MDILKYQNTELSSTFKPLSISTHSGINAHFSKNADDFVVRELPLYVPSKEGEHMMIHVQKKGLSTKEMLSAFSAFTGAKMRDIGYAGLKDKEGLTSQYITIPAKFCGKLSSFSHQNIKILSSALHANKLRVGHLKGNAFFIRLKKVSKTDALKLEQALANTLKNGVPNYFGYQRFGKFKDNAKSGFQLLSALK